MLRSQITEFESKILPRDFDLDQSLSIVGKDLYILDMNGDEFSNELRELYFTGIIEKKIFNDYPGISREKVDIILSRSIKHAHEGNKDILRFFNNVHSLFSQGIQPYLQFKANGNQIYYPEDSVQSNLKDDHISRENVEKLINKGSFEILLDAQDICCDFAEMRKRILKKNDLDGISLLDGNLSVIFSQAIKDKESYMVLNFKLFTTNGRSVKSRSCYLILGEAQLLENDIDRAIIAGLNAVGEDPIVPMEDTCRFSRKMAIKTLNAGGLLFEKGVAHGEEVNPFRKMKARISNTGIPQKQREKARNLLPGLHDMSMVPLYSGGAKPPSVNEIAEIMTRKTELPDWVTEKTYQEARVITDSPRSRNPHGKQHPQRMMKDFPALGEDRENLGFIYEDAMHNLQKKMQKEFMPAGDENSVQIGAEGIRIDQMALDITSYNSEDVQHLMVIYQSFIMDLPFEERPETIEPFQGLLNLHTAIKKYKASGSQCFILNGDVATLMRRTDISDIDIPDLRLPYEAMYLSFDTPIEMDLDGVPHVFDGAYLSGSRMTLEILMVFEPVEKTGAFLPDFRNPLKISLPRQPGLSLQDAILRAIENGGYDMDRGEKLEITPEIEAMAETMGVDVKTLERSSQEEIVDRNERLFGSLVDAVTIVANTIMAMTSGPEEIQVQETWISPSQNLLHALGRTSPKAKKETLEIAQQENAMPVRVISLTQAAKDRQNEQSSEARKSPEEAYWRRGHWRHQAYGKGHSLRRWTWIEPQLCNQDAALKRSGTVYHASSEDLSM